LFQSIKLSFNKNKTMTKITLCLYLFFIALLCVCNVQGDISGSQINLIADLNQTAKIVFGQEHNTYTMGARPEAFFIARDKTDLFRIESTGEVIVNTDILSAKSFATEQLVIHDVVQWSLNSLEMFDEISPLAAGWSHNETIKCSGLAIFLAHKKHVHKVYHGLPHHSQLRLEATAHFIDDWQGEIAFLKVNDHIVWTEGHDQKHSQSKLSVCGSDIIPESKFSVAIDVTFPHRESTLVVQFGTTIPQDAPQTLFGFSSLSISSRSFRPHKPIE